MTDEDGEEGWEAWLGGDGDTEPDERFKWGWNPERGETVWIVGGPGDGFPSHVEHLEPAWGKAPNMAQGDVLGVASHYASGVGEEDGVRDVIVIDAYFGKPVPASVIDWFKAGFPEALLRPSGA